MRSLILSLAVVCAIACPLRAGTAGAPSMTVDDFSDEPLERFPTRWQSRDPKTAERVYTVTAENGQRFLKAVAQAQAAQIGIPVKTTVDEYPALSWRWRVAEFPTGSCEREKATNDSAAGVYVVFKGSFGGLVPRAIKYVWSAREPRGAAFPSPGYSTAQIVVLESGTEAAGEWRTETVNIATDYRRLFQADPPEVQGIAVLTDADDTGTRAVADYADFRLLAAATASGSAITPSAH
jgi:hypothetical protein